MAKKRTGTRERVELTPAQIDELVNAAGLSETEIEEMMRWVPGYFGRVRTNGYMDKARYDALKALTDGDGEDTPTPAPGDSEPSEPAETTTAAEPPPEDDYSKVDRVDAIRIATGLAALLPSFGFQLIHGCGLDTGIAAKYANDLDDNVLRAWEGLEVAVRDSKSPVRRRWHTIRAALETVQRLEVDLGSMPPHYVLPDVPETDSEAMQQAEDAVALAKAAGEARDKALARVVELERQLQEERGKAVAQVAEITHQRDAAQSKLDEIGAVAAHLKAEREEAATRYSDRLREIDELQAKIAAHEAVADRLAHVTEERNLLKVRLAEARLRMMSGKVESTDGGDGRQSGPLPAIEPRELVIGKVREAVPIPIQDEWERWAEAPLQDLSTMIDRASRTLAIRQGIEADHRKLEKLMADWRRRSKERGKPRSRKGGAA